MSKVNKENLHIVVNSEVYCSHYSITIEDIREFLITMCDNIDDITFILAEACEFLTKEHWLKIQSSLTDILQIIALVEYDIPEDWFLNWIKDVPLTEYAYSSAWYTLSYQLKDNKIRKYLFDHMYQAKNIQYFLDSKHLTSYEKEKIVTFYESEILSLTIGKFYCVCLIFSQILTTKIKDKLIEFFMIDEDVETIKKLLLYCNFTKEEIAKVESIINLWIIKN